MRAKFWLAGAAAVAILVGLTAALLVVKSARNRWFWDHWDVAKPGVLYRSGQLTPEQLAEAVRQYGLRTVVNFKLDPWQVAAERKLCKELGVDFVNLPMPGDGLGKPEQFREILKILDDPARRPIVVHCARGTCRTGAAVGLYRLERDGWAPEDVVAELRRQTYRDEWLPGYVLGMARPRMFYDLNPSPTIVDRNAPEQQEAARDGNAKR